MAFKFVVVCFAGGGFDSAHGYNSDAEASAFRDGCSVGSGAYGAGSFLAFTLPTEDALLDDPNEAASIVDGEVERARAAAKVLLQP